MAVSNVGGQPSQPTAFPDPSMNGAFPLASANSPMPNDAIGIAPQSQSSGLY